jgi:hypothetical protein
MVNGFARIIAFEGSLPCAPRICLDAAIMRICGQRWLVERRGLLGQIPSGCAACGQPAKPAKSCVQNSRRVSAVSLQPEARSRNQNRAAKGKLNEFDTSKVRTSQMNVRAPYR